jgi:hypothetical protein
MGNLHEKLFAQNFSSGFGDLDEEHAQMVYKFFGSEDNCRA